MLYVKTHRYDPEKDTDPRVLVDLGIPIEFEGGSFWRDMSDPLFVAHRQGALDLQADWAAQKYQTEIVVNRRVADVLRPPLAIEAFHSSDVFTCSKKQLDAAADAFASSGWTIEYSSQIPAAMQNEATANRWAPYGKTSESNKVFGVQAFCFNLTSASLRDACVDDITDTLTAYHADAWSTAAKLGWWARKPSWGPARPKAMRGPGTGGYLRGYSEDGPLVCSTKWENPYRTGEFEWCLSDIIRRVYAQTGKPCILHELVNENLQRWPLGADLLERGMVRLGW